MDELLKMFPVWVYFHPAKFIVMLVLLTPWLYVCPWVQKDARSVRTSHTLWGGLVLGIGTLCMFIWLLSPVYVVGLLVYVVLTGAVLVAYVVHRNAKVPPEQKILTADHLRSLSQRREARGVEVAQKVKLYTRDGRSAAAPGPEADTAERETYNAVQDLLHDLLWRRASEAELAPAGESTTLRLAIDGVTHEDAGPDPAVAEGVIQYLKGVGGMDVEERRRPQRGRITVDLANSPIDMDLVTAGTTSGQRMQFRVVQEFIRTRLGELGIPEDLLTRLRELNQAGNGILIVSGRRGSGVTSTLYSLLREHDAFIKQLITLEHEPEVDLENVTQNQYEDAKEMPRMLASALRRDPDVILLDQVADADTAAQITELAGEKTFIIGMAAGDSLKALAKWVQTCGSAAKAVEHLRCVTAQMLLRKLCPNCKDAYHPDPNLLAKANLSAEHVEHFYRPPAQFTDEKGRPAVCPTCQNVGYFGRTGAFELLEVTDELRQLIASGASLSEIKAACRKNNMLYLQEQALRKVIQGETSVQEVIRVSQKKK
jgi:type II secretory ATPase GspE/PulE/Tfp pilus assembly ATPase PilB-like protein